MEEEEVELQFEKLERCEGIFLLLTVLLGIVVYCVAKLYSCYTHDSCVLFAVSAIVLSIFLTMGIITRKEREIEQGRKSLNLFT